MTHGVTGSCPSWYRYLCAARWLGVSPWELVTVPLYWIRWAELASQAEAARDAAEARRRATHAATPF